MKIIGLSKSLLKIHEILCPLFNSIRLSVKKTIFEFVNRENSFIGKTVIVIGANTGTRFETALELAKRGARVILACRNKKTGEEARRRIIKKTGNQNIIVKIIDLTSFESVRVFARDINKGETRLDLLVNSVGTFKVSPIEVKDEKFHILLQVNYLSNFLLTNLLIGLLRKTKSSRIVNVATIINFAALEHNNFEDILKEDVFDFNKKMCNILFTRELAERLKGSGVTTFSVSPVGAKTIIFTCIAKGIGKSSGRHFYNCKEVKCFNCAKDKVLAKNLWEKSEELVTLTEKE